MCDAGEFMQNNWEQDHDASQKDLTEAPVDPGFYADPTANFDPIVQDALGGAEDIGPLVDETLANLPAPEVPTSGPFAGLEGGVPGGSGTEAVAGFINSRGTDITDMIHQIEAGEDLTPEQMAEGEHIIKSGMNTDPLPSATRSTTRPSTTSQRLTYGNVQTDSGGGTGATRPRPTARPRRGRHVGAHRGHPAVRAGAPSLSEFWGETADITERPPSRGGAARRRARPEGETRSRRPD